MESNTRWTRTKHIPGRSAAGRRKRGSDDRLSLGEDAAPVSFVLEAFAVNLVDVLGAGRTRREPSVGRDHLQPADRRAVARSVTQDLQDGFAGQIRGPDLLRRQGRKP